MEQPTDSTAPAAIIAGTSTSTRIKCAAIAAVGLPGAAFVAIVIVVCTIRAVGGVGVHLLSALVMYPALIVPLVFYGVFAFKGVRNASVKQAAIAATIGAIIFVALTIVAFIFMPRD